MNYSLIGTISDTHKRCKAENIGINLNHLRYLCKNKIIPTCKIGRKYLINWNVLMDYLNGNSFEISDKSNKKGKIRRIDD